MLDFVAMEKEHRQLLGHYPAQTASNSGSDAEGKDNGGHDDANRPSGTSCCALNCHLCLIFDPDEG